MKTDPKSWKREVALFLIAFWTLLATRVFFFLAEPETLGEILIGLTPFLLVPAIAVFLGHYVFRDKKPPQKENPDEEDFS